MTRRLHDSGFTISVPRTTTPIDLAKTRAREQLWSVMMHVRLGDVRHKMMLDHEIIRRGKWDVGIANGRTCCDETLAGKYYAAIDAGYLSPPGMRLALCKEGCFSKAELRVAKEMQLDEDNRLAAKAASDEADRVESNGRAKFERAEARRRVEDYRRTGETAPIIKPDVDDD